jgi:hypothetical protein
LTPTTSPEGVEVGDGLGEDDRLGVGDGLGENDGLELGDGDGDGEAVGDVGTTEPDEVGFGPQVACGRWLAFRKLAADTLCAGLPATTRPTADAITMASTLALIERECRRLCMRGTPGERGVRGALARAQRELVTQEFGRLAGAFNTPIGRSACVLVRFEL